VIGTLTRSTTVLVGEFGAGKTEISIALALRLAAAGERVSLVDLDIVTPYFRPRDIAPELERAGVTVIAPQGLAASTSLPAVPGGVATAVAEGCAGRRTVLVDPGGGEPGTRVFGSLRDALRGERLRVLLVLNRYRGDATPEGLRTLADAVTNGTGLRITHLVSNSHLRGDTDEALVTEGVAWARDMSERLALPLLFAAALDGMALGPDGGILGVPVLPLKRRLRLPWED